MKISAQAKAFFSDKTEDRTTLLKHLRIQVNPHLAIDKLQKSVSRRNTLRKIGNVFIRILTLNIVRNAFGRTFNKATLSGRVRDLRSQAIGPKPLVDFLKGMPKGKTELAVRRAFNCAWTDFAHAEDYLEDVLDEGVLADVKDNYELVKAIKTKNYTKLKELMPSYPPAARKHLVRYMLDMQPSQKVVRALDIIDTTPTVSTEIFASLSNANFKDLFIQSEIRPTSDTAKAKISQEFKQRFKANGYTLLLGLHALVPEGKFTPVMQRICEAIKDVELTSQFKAIFNRSATDWMTDELFNLSCLFNFPNNFKTLIDSNYKRGLLSPLGFVQTYVWKKRDQSQFDSMVRASGIDKRLVKKDFTRRTHEMLYGDRTPEQLLKGLEDSLLSADDLKVFAETFDTRTLELHNETDQKLYIYMKVAPYKNVPIGNHTTLILELHRQFPSRTEYLLNHISDIDLLLLLRKPDLNNPNLTEAMKKEVQIRLLTGELLKSLPEAMSMADHDKSPVLLERIVDVLNEMELTDEFKKTLEGALHEDTLVKQVLTLTTLFNFSGEFVAFFDETFKKQYSDQLGIPSTALNLRGGRPHIYEFTALTYVQIDHAIKNRLHDIFYSKMSKQQLLDLIKNNDLSSEQKTMMSETLIQERLDLDNTQQLDKRLEILIKLKLDDEVDYHITGMKMEDCFLLYPEMHQEILSNRSSQALSWLIMRHIYAQEQLPMMNRVQEEVQRRMQQGDLSFFSNYAAIQFYATNFGKGPGEVHHQAYEQLKGMLEQVEINDAFKQGFETTVSVDDLNYLFALSSMYKLPEELEKLIRSTISKKCEGNAGNFDALFTLKKELCEQIVVISGLDYKAVFNLLKTQKDALLAKCINVSHLPGLLKTNDAARFQSTLTSFMGVANVNVRKREYIAKSYENYFVIKAKYNEIITAYNRQFARRRNLWFLPGTKPGNELPIHFEHYHNVKMLKAVLDNYLGAMEKIIEVGIVNDSLKDALNKGFITSNNCLDIRGTTLEEYLIIAYCDEDYVANFDEAHTLYQNISEFLRVYQNIFAKEYAKNNKDTVCRMLETWLQGERAKQVKVNEERMVLLAELEGADVSWFRKPNWMKVRRCLQGDPDFHDKTILGGDTAKNHKNQIARAFQEHIQRQRQIKDATNKKWDAFVTKLKSRNLFASAAWFKDDEWKNLRGVIQCDEAFIQEFMTKGKFKEHLIKNFSILTRELLVNEAKVPITEEQVDAELQNLIDYEDLLVE